MAYIPKSQIKENQFTPGAEWYYIKNNASYTGFYFMLSNGKAFTGKNPNSPPNEEIVKKTPLQSPQSKNQAISSEPITSEYADNIDGYVFEEQYQKAKDVEIYGILMDTDYNLIRTKPQSINPLPTPEDYEKEIFIRYFVCKVNELEFLEVSKETYDNIDTKNAVWMWEDYISFTLNWSIKGNIDRAFNNNRGAIFLAEKQIKRKGLDNYLGRKYLKYFHHPEASNLNTNGGELIYSTGEDYIGSYHINLTQGPMQGISHQSLPHQKLYYKRFYRGKIVDSLNQKGVIETGETQNIEYRSIISIDPINGKSSTEGGY
jgi:hypothetical protein